MRRYQCHKKVEAAKIVDVPAPHDAVGALRDDYFIRHESGTVTVDGEWIANHQPEVGMYLVWYEDGHLSVSPAASFEAGYTEITE